MLSLQGVSVRYPTGTLALDDVTLELAAGEFVSVVGPSGCGKTTLLRLAAGLLAPTAGTISRGGDQVGYVFQDPTLLPWRSVRANVELAGELRGMSKPARRAKAEAVLERVGLTDFADQRPATLSAGMRMRVSLARTLLLRPSIMLLDEPFAAVDEINRVRLGEDLQELFVADGFCALLVTHSVAEAVFLSSRVVVLSARPGRILGVFDVPTHFPRPPKLRYTADFADLTGRVHALLAGEATATGPRELR